MVWFCAICTKLWRKIHNFSEVHASEPATAQKKKKLRRGRCRSCTYHLRHLRATDVPDFDGKPFKSLKSYKDWLCGWTGTASECGPREICDTCIDGGLWSIRDHCVVDTPALMQLPGGNFTRNPADYLIQCKFSDPCARRNGRITRKKKRSWCFQFNSHDLNWFEIE